MIYLMFYYRNVGLHDGFVYIQAGQDIANGKNPYSEGITRSGTVSSLFIFFIYALIPKAITAQIFQLINLGCIAWFLWVVKGKQWKIDDFLLAVLISFWLSPIRELLAINQVNAIVVALLGTAIWLNSKTRVIKQFRKNASIGLCFALAIDLKPHLLLVVILVWAILERSSAIISWTIAIFISLHIAIDIHIGEISELTWISRVIDVKDGADTAELGDSVTIWPIFQNLFPNLIEYMPRFSLVLYLIISAFAVYAAIKRKTNIAILLALTAPAFYIYFHFYDMIPMVLIFVVYLIQSRTQIEYIAMLSLILIPKEFTNLRNLFLVVLICTLISLHERIQIIQLKKVLLGLLGYGVICVINSLLFGGPRLTQSIFVTEIMLLCLWANIRMSKNNYIKREILDSPNS